MKVLIPVICYCSLGEVAVIDNKIMMLWKAETAIIWT